MLFEPIKINKLEIKNRFCRSATGERRSEHTGHVTDALIEYYENLAKMDIGLIIAGHSYVMPNGKAGYRMSGLHDDSVVPKWMRLTARVHETNSKIFSQLDHGGGQVASGIVEMQTVAPSAVANYNFGVVPKKLTANQIEELIDAFIDAGRRSKEAGFDGIQIFCSHGYLINQFLSPYINQRTDEWGGTLENRFRFLRSIYEGIRKKVGADYPIIAKFPIEDFTNPGLSTDDCIWLALQLQELGIDGFEISGGMSTIDKNCVRAPIKTRSQEAYFLPYIGMLRRAGITKSLILVGGIRSKDVMEMLLQEKQVDMVSMCRPFVCEPDFVIRIKNGQEKSKCANCNQCLNKFRQPTICHTFGDAR
jgi:2,4-dienoyl-CoA reductase-like NADH-dependent reductase (Old Yellow Enzyme family)